MKLKYGGTPSDCFGKSLKNIMTRTEWDNTRRTVYRKHKWTCQLCSRNSFDNNFPSHAHEEWEYKVTKNGCVRYLKEIMCLCPDCHAIKHIGRQKILLNNGRITEQQFENLQQHFADVNGISLDDAKKMYIEGEEEAWEQIIYETEEFEVTDWKHVLPGFEIYEKRLDEVEAKTYD